MGSSQSTHNHKQNGVQARVRRFRAADTERIHELYLEAMLRGRDSPAALALRHQLRRPPSLVLYSLFTLGLALSRRSLTRIPGVLLSTAAAGLFFAWRRNIWKRFNNFCQSAVKGDLADIAKRYGSEDEETANPPNPNGFWVAEIANGSKAGTIIGCIGLDSSTKPDPSTIELLRLSVSPLYRQCGVGSSLVTTAIAHARERGFSSLFLSTSSYQTSAMRLYEKFGFVEEKKMEVKVRYLIIVSKAYLHFFRLKL